MAAAQRALGTPETPGAVAKAAAILMALPQGSVQPPLGSHDGKRHHPAHGEAERGKLQGRNPRRKAREQREKGPERERPTAGERGG